MLEAEGAPPSAVRDVVGAVQAALRGHKDGSVVEDTAVTPARWTLG
jgi:hypothetical protein